MELNPIADVRISALVRLFLDAEIQSCFFMGQYV
jgi:hypothetical protein